MIIPPDVVYRDKDSYRMHGTGLSVHADKEWDMTATSTNIDSTLPDLTLPSLDGGEIQFRSLLGKRRLLFFWGSW